MAGVEPSVMTVEKVAEILAQISLGLRPYVAARRCGVKKQTFHDYLKRHPEERLRIEQAEAQAEGSMWARMIRHSEESWQACAWVLERRFDYTKPEHVSRDSSHDDTARDILAALREMESLDG